MMGQFGHQLEFEERGGSLDVVESPEHGADRVHVLWIAFEGQEGLLGVGDQVAAFVDEFGNQFEIGVLGHVIMRVIHPFRHGIIPFGFHPGRRGLRGRRPLRLPGRGGLHLGFLGQRKHRRDTLFIGDGFFIGCLHRLSGFHGAQGFFQECPDAGRHGFGNFPHLAAPAGVQRGLGQLDSALDRGPAGARAFGSLGDRQKVLGEPHQFVHIPGADLQQGGGDFVQGDEQGFLFVVTGVTFRFRKGGPGWIGSFFGNRRHLGVEHPVQQLARFPDGPGIFRVLGDEALDRVEGGEKPLENAFRIGGLVQGQFPHGFDAEPDQLENVGGGVRNFVRQFLELEADIQHRDGVVPPGGRKFLPYLRDPINHFFLFAGHMRSTC